MLTLMHMCRHTDVVQSKQTSIYVYTTHTLIHAYKMLTHTHSHTSIQERKDRNIEIKTNDFQELSTLMLALLLKFRRILEYNYFLSFSA